MGHGFRSHSTPVVANGPQALLVPDSDGGREKAQSKPLYPKSV